ncbi:septal ring lytic transglycosylase RlpA family protein [Erythrobacter sp. HL-111]|uniref:septal ring lytic transglycosylase RlpA family protein n=1 Tax=Erythrobacter sp. HL-111 TaxID=1798193 RepID=UPI0006DB762E|nr:MAG: rare lipoprotein A [Erythrobacteraceae bacterium HL-111]SDS14274.1 rare lipoprotein A [Erythrobacter sp. HL-111]
MGKFHPTSAVRSRAASRCLALGLVLAAAALGTGPAAAQDRLVADDRRELAASAAPPGQNASPAGEAPSDSAALASAPAPSRQPRDARTAGTAPASFAAAFSTLAEAPRPDLAVPESAVDIDAIEPAIEIPAFRSLGSGTASYYGRRFHGRRTANGERFDMNALTAAHRTLPFGSLVRVTNPSNGRSVTVRINDRGPFSRGRVIDVSRAAAEELGLIRRGHAPVELELLE